jgi:hypothetical protein
MFRGAARTRGRLLQLIDRRPGLPACLRRPRALPSAFGFCWAALGNHLPRLSAKD